MRSLFTTGAKLLGIIFLYWSLIALTGLITSLQHIEDLGLSLVVTTLVSASLTFCLSYLLLFRTEGIADYLRVPDYELNHERFSHESALRVGIVLVGIYAFVTKIGPFVRVLYARIMMIAGPKSIYAPPWISTVAETFSTTLDVIVQAAIIALSLFLVFRSGDILRLIEKLGTRAT